jgi:hypothetical protein
MLRYIKFCEVNFTGRSNCTDSKYFVGWAMPTLRFCATYVGASLEVMD